LQPSGTRFECGARLRCAYCRSSAGTSNAKRSGSNPGERATSRSSSGPGNSVLTRATRIRLPHATLMSLPADPAPTLRTLVAKVQLFPGTLLALAEGSALRLRSAVAAVRFRTGALRGRGEVVPVWLIPRRSRGSNPALASVATQGATRLS
jgi:hypothetical protein